jgi:dienelactone hydrolase
MVVDAVQKYKVPWSLAIGTEDARLKPKDVEQLKSALEALGEGCKDRWKVRSYEGALHGFAVRAEPGDEVQRKCGEEALGQALEWFGRWEGKGEGEGEGS